LRFPIEVDSKLKHVKKLLTRKNCSVCCKHKDTSSDPPGEGEGQHNKERQQQHETRFSPTLVIRSYQQVDRKLSVEATVSHAVDAANVQAYFHEDVVRPQPTLLPGCSISKENSPGLWPVCIRFQKNSQPKHLLQRPAGELQLAWGVLHELHG
jgi:hypothetical protein